MLFCLTIDECHNQQGVQKMEREGEGDSVGAGLSAANNIKKNNNSEGIMVTGNTKWDTMYKHLVEYKRTHNDCLVPNRYKKLPQLGSWVSTQRRHYKMLQTGKDSPLDQERLDLLTRIGFVWATKDPRHVSLKFVIIIHHHFHL